MEEKAGQGGSGIDFRKKERQQEQEPSLQSGNVAVPLWRFPETLLPQASTLPKAWWYRAKCPAL